MAHIDFNGNTFILDNNSRSLRNRLELLVETLVKSTSEVLIETILFLFNVEGSIGGTFKPESQGNADLGNGDLEHLFMPCYECLIY